MSIKDDIKAQLDHMNDRERRMVYAAVIAIAIFIPYQFIWTPIVDTARDRKESVEKKERDLIWMKTKGPEIQRLSSASSAPQSTGTALYGIVEQTARARFGESIRVQQEGKNGIRIQLQDVSFDTMMIWMDDLQNRHQIVVKDFKIDKEKTEGRVRASILVES